MYYKEEFEKISKILNPKGYKSGLSTLLALIDKLDERKIEDETLQDMFSQLLNLLVEYGDGDSTKKKKIRRMYSTIINYVSSRHRLVQRGTLQGVFLSVFMGAGVAIGVAFSANNPSFLTIGIAAGMILGVAVGALLERKAKKEGRAY